MRRLLVLLGLVLGSAAGAETVAPMDGRWAFRVDWGPVALAEGRISLIRTAEQTAFDASAKSVGAAQLFQRFSVQSAVRYLTDGGRELELIVAGSDGHDRRAMRWQPDGTPVVLEQGREDREDGPLTPVPEKETRDTVDPFYPILGTMERLDAQKNCAQTYRVYDGTRRYNVWFTDMGQDMIVADRDWSYAGPARKCQMHFKRVGGFSADQDVSESDYTRHIWFASLDGGFIPVLFRAEWSLGYATARVVVP